jgi:hypothetical protein
MNEKGLPTIHFVPTVDKIKVELTDMYGMLQAGPKCFRVACLFVFSNSVSCFQTVKCSLSFKACHEIWHLP